MNRLTGETYYKCEFCRVPTDTLYEGWFYAVATNEWNVGTATAGLLHLKRGCKQCVNELIRAGRAKAKELIQ